MDFMDFESSNSQDDSLLYITFNQDCSYIITGTQRGFKIFNSNPLELRYERSKNNIIIKNYSIGWWNWNN